MEGTKREKKGKEKKGLIICLPDSTHPPISTQIIIKEDN